MANPGKKRSPKGVPPENADAHSADAGFGSPRQAEGAVPGRHAKPQEVPEAKKSPAVQGGDDLPKEAESGGAGRSADVSRNADDIDAILAEVEQKRKNSQSTRDVRTTSSAPSEADEAAHSGQVGPVVSHAEEHSHEEPEQAPVKTKAAPAKRTSEDKPEQAAQAARSGKREKTRKPNPFVRALKTLIPWRGDSVLECVRKIVFFAALCVVSICAFLISDYYVGLYQDKQSYQDIQDELDRHYMTDDSDSGPVIGEELEYLEYNEIADLFLKQNPDLVGYIQIEGTEVSYPVVQKKSPDPLTVNTNDYYLYRNFQQETSKSGSIFMDFRCHFDEAFEHRRICENSGNLLIYGHNMKNRSMFGSLKDYVRNYSFLSQHPIVHLQSLYLSYDYKIFAVFLIDSSDTDSEYGFDCWNTIDFADENEFYWYVNNAKKRNIITNTVDVKYGDPILTLYTCNSTVANAKLIIMARQLRDGEDPNEGYENSGLSDNILYPKAYYRFHEETFDPDRFVPYGPEPAAGEH